MSYDFPVSFSLAGTRAVRLSFPPLRHYPNHFRLQFDFWLHLGQQIDQPLELFHHRRTPSSFCWVAERLAKKALQLMWQPLLDPCRARCPRLHRSRNPQVGKLLNQRHQEANWGQLVKSPRHSDKPLAYQAHHSYQTAYLYSCVMLIAGMSRKLYP